MSQRDDGVPLLPHRDRKHLLRRSSKFSREPPIIPRTERRLGDAGGDRCWPSPPGARTRGHADVDAAGSALLRPACACALCRNAERGFGTRAGNSSSSSSLRHHNKLIPTSLTSHSRQSYRLGARRGRTLAHGAGCRATARLGLAVTRVLMAGLLGDGSGDVSLRDVSPRDRPSTGPFHADARELVRERMRKQAVNVSWTLWIFSIFKTTLEFHSSSTKKYTFFNVMRAMHGFKDTV